MQRKDVVKAVAAIAQSMSCEIEDCGKITRKTLDEFDRLIIECEKNGFLVDSLYDLSVSELHIVAELCDFPDIPWYTGIHKRMIAKNWDLINLKCQVRSLVDSIEVFKKKQDPDSAVTLVFAQKFTEWLSENERGLIASQLKARGAEIFRFLLSKPKGVTFEDFQEAGLTNSDNKDSIKAMLSKLSGELAEYGYQIKISVAKNLIRLERFD